MNTIVTGKIEAVFAEHLQGVAKESRKPYNFINLSNGIEKVAFSTSLNKDDTNNLQPGDVVTVQVSLNPWDTRKNMIDAIE